MGDNVSESESDDAEDEGDVKKRMRQATKRQKVDGDNYKSKGGRME